MSENETTECQQQSVDVAAQRSTLDGLGNIMGLQAAAGCDQASPPKIVVAINANAAETLRCLFFHGPTWDGNVPSKSGRDELVDMKLAARGQGWQWLTRAGIEACFANGIHHEKERRESRERMRRIRLEEAARSILS